MKGNPEASFDYCLNNLPENNSTLSSDASTSWGMAGVILFQPNTNQMGFDGLFWQLSWVAWARLNPMDNLLPGCIAINVAEFLAALITCETFAEFCCGKITTIEIDNVSAKS